MKTDPEPVAKAAPTHKKYYRVIALAFVPVSLLVFEAVLRLAWPQPARGFTAGIWERKNGLQRLRPGVIARQYSREFNVEVAADPDGYRLGLSSTGEPDILLLGDSFAFGWGVEAQESAAGILKCEGVKLRCWAIPGDGFEDVLTRAREAQERWRSIPKIVYLLYDNDFSEWPPGPEAPAGSPGLRERLGQLHTLRALARLSDSLGTSSWVANRLGYESALKEILRRDLKVHSKTESIQSEPAWQRCREVLTELRKSGAKVYLVRVTPVYAAGGPASEEAGRLLGKNLEDWDFRRVDMRLGQLCDEIGVIYTSFRPKIEEEEKYFFPFDRHLSAAGQAALAETIRQLIGKGEREGAARRDE